MANFSLPMVLKIKEVLDDFKDPDYSFEHDEDSASFTLRTEESTTGESLLIQLTIRRDEDEDDLISVLSFLDIDFDNEFEESLEVIAAKANEGAEGRDDWEMFVHEGDEGELNLISKNKFYFDEDICDDENEDEFTAFVQNVIGGACTEFALVAPLIALLTGGEEAAKEALGRLQSEVENAKQRTERGGSESSGTLDDLLEKLVATKADAQKGDVDAQVEFGKSLQILYADEACSEEDEDQSAIYWFKKAAKQGHPEARYLVARCFHEGKNVKKSRKSAIEWYKKQIDFVLESDNKDPELIKQALAGLEELGEQASTTLAYPVTYGKSTFKSVDDIIDNMDTNPDALGLFSQCTIFGASFVKRGTLGINGLFEAANKGSTDAILGLGRLYEVGYDFLARDVNAALTLYKYAYSLKNVDALLSLGQILFSTFGKKEIGLSMMQRAADMGSEIAETQLELIKELISGVSPVAFDDIPKAEFKYDEMQLANYLQLYFIDLSDEAALKTAILDIMMNMKPETFSIIMNEFRVKYLRRRKLMHFTDRVNFAGIFDDLVKEGLVEARNVGDYGIAENTIYSAKASTHKMKSVTLDWDDI